MDGTQMTPEEKKQKLASIALAQEALKKKILKQRETLENIAMNGINSEGDRILAQAICCWFSAHVLYEEAVLKDKFAGDSWGTDLDKWLEELTKDGEDNEA